MKFADRAFAIAARPVPLRSILLRALLKKWPIGSYRTRLEISAVQRAHYGWCVYHAAEEAKALGHKAITVVEFGVAGGNGLVSLCQHKKETEKATGVEVLIVGFDTGKGLPTSGDSRDLLYFWPAGSFEMDREALERRVAGQAELVIGNVATTIPTWEPRQDAPIGAVLFDLDLYTSTMVAFRILDKSNLLPRMWCYFDDIHGYPESAYSDSIGEREAIKQFNLAPERKRRNDHLSRAYVFKGVASQPWHEDIYLYHQLNHPDYNRCLSQETKHQLRLTA
jgi:hypothetical protein